jgi:hypothetical protein
MLQALIEAVVLAFGLFFLVISKLIGTIYWLFKVLTRRGGE